MSSSTPSHSSNSSGARNSGRADVENVGLADVVKLEILPPLPGLALEAPKGWTFDHGRSYPIPLDEPVGSRFFGKLWGDGDTLFAKPNRECQGTRRLGRRQSRGCLRGTEFCEEGRDNLLRFDGRQGSLNLGQLRLSHGREIGQRLRGPVANPPVAISQKTDQARFIFFQPDLSQRRHGLHTDVPRWVREIDPDHWKVSRITAFPEEKETSGNHILGQLLLVHELANNRHRIVATQCRQQPDKTSSNGRRC